MIKVAIGSTNPVKCEAAKQALTQLLPNEQFEFIEVAVDSGVADQPMTDQETLQGAINRAKAAQKQADADYGVGLEGGQSQVDGRQFTGSAAAVVTKDGTLGLGFGPRVLTPSGTKDHIAKGHNLSEAVAKTHGVTDIGKKQGLLGLMTKNLITRTSSSRDAVITALGPLIQP